MAANRKDITNEEVLEVYERSGGSIRETADELGLVRSSVRNRLKKLGKNKPVAAGTVAGVEATDAKLPKKGEVKRYILTSAQNNTFVHEDVWASLLALADHYGAELLVGTFSYNQNAYGKMAVKKGKEKAKEAELWYAKEVLPFVRDERKELGRGLVWCGEMNILPTAANPLAGLESYSARLSAIFPHAKMAMRSVPTMQGEGTKLNFTTGTVTKMNYIQKREGLIAEHHHVYGGLLVEVNSDGNWWVRQLNCESDGTVQDLGVLVKGGKVTTGNRVEAITWGDLHSTFADPDVVKVSLAMLDELKPRFQFMHDVLEGSSINHHAKDNPHFKFWNWLRGLHRLDAELAQTAALMSFYSRPWSEVVVVDSNHDDPWIQRWLREYDYRKDPPNTEIFLKAQAYMYEQIKAGKMPRDVNMTQWCLRQTGCLSVGCRFLVSDESFLICKKRIECGQHGHLGPAGSRGTPENLSKMGRRANTAHTHSAGIWNGLFVAGTSSRFRWPYNRGPNGWSHSHIVTYPSGKRTIVTIYAGKWRA